MGSKTAKNCVYVICTWPLGCLLFFLSLHVLFRELRKVVDDGRTGGIVRPGRPELLQLAYHNSLPFVGKTGITVVPVAD